MPDHTHPDIEQRLAALEALSRAERRSIRDKAGCVELTQYKPATDDAAAIPVIAASIRAHLYRHGSGDYESSARALAEDIVARRLTGVWAYPEREHPGVTIARLTAELEQARRKRDAEIARLHNCLHLKAAELEQYRIAWEAERPHRE